MQKEAINTRWKSGLNPPISKSFRVKKLMLNRLERAD